MKKLITLFLVTFMLATIFAGCWNEKIAEISTTTTEESTTATYPVSIPNETESTEPVTEPTVTSSEPVTEPTVTSSEPVTEATEPSETESTEPATEVTEPSETEVTEPVVEPTETEPVVEPTDPVTEPTQTIPSTETTEVPVITEPVVTDPPVTEPVVTEPPTEATTVPTEPPHVHEYVEKVVAPTCTKKGYTIHTCACGDSFKDNETRALGHRFDSYVSNDDATCEQDGTKTAVCENGCGEKDTVKDTDSALGHNYSDKVVPATCTEKGYTVHTCKVCGNSYQDRETKATGHKFSSYVSNNDATCEKAGSKTAVCENGCGVTDTVTDTDTPIGHKYSKSVTEPTCTKDGFTKYVCSVCEYAYTGDTIKALGHDFICETVKNPSCTEDGYSTFRCSRCEKDKTGDVIKALGHNLTEIDHPSTCTQAGYLLGQCNRCEHTEILKQYELAEHQYQVSVKAPTCTEGGYSTHQCQVCGDSFEDGHTDATGHSFTKYRSNRDAKCEQDGTKTAVCDNGCGEEHTVQDVGSAKVHQMISYAEDPTCTKSGIYVEYCNYCDFRIEEELPAIGSHEWGEWIIEKNASEETEGIEYRICSRCKETERRTIPILPKEMRWYAIGDSITQGFNSKFNEEGESKIGLNPKKCWAQLAANQLGFELTNSGVGGSGYVAKGTVKDKLTGRDHVDTVDFSEADLVTIAFGINDWKYNAPLGSMEDDVTTGGTIYSNMRYIIEKILADNPDVQIIVISPMNCTLYGDAETGWGLNYSFSKSGTLEDVFQAEKEVCEYYGLPFIDMLHNNPVVTIENAPQVLPDGIHPSLECHAELALDLTEKIMDILDAVTSE